MATTKTFTLGLFGEKMKLSCGVIIINEENELFLAHSTGNKFYDIPKGMLDENENPSDCAVRECLEETSIIIDKNQLIDLGEHKYNKEKNLHLFIYPVNKSDINLESLVCNSFFICPYTKKEKPEADGFKWFNQNELTENCAKSMGKLLGKLKEEGLFIYSNYQKNKIKP